MRKISLTALTAGGKMFVDHAGNMLMVSDPSAVKSGLLLSSIMREAK
jgi:hypothetical protein